MDDSVKQYLSEIGRRGGEIGGKSTSPAKRAATKQPKNETFTNAAASAQTARERN